MALQGDTITILGAGVAGLALALALARRGAVVTVLEQADAIREVGAGLQIAPNGAVVLSALGLKEGLDAVATRAIAVDLRCGLTDSSVLRLDLQKLRPGQAYRFVHRADLIALLLKAALAAGVTLHLLQKVARVDLTGPRPRFALQTGAEHDAGFVVGADGLHSVVRQALNGTVAPFFTHQVAWRALVPCEPEASPVAEVHMGPGRHLVSYPLRGGTLRNIVAVEERRRWVEESWSLQDDPMELQLAFESFGPRVQGWLGAVGQVNLWGLFRHPVAKVWAAPNAAILGDAAHPTLPFLAQGANMALEDAWTLAKALDAPDRASALAQWQAARAPRCARIVEAASANGRTYHRGGLGRDVMHLGMRTIGRLAPDFALRRFDWLYNHDATAA